MSRLTDGSRVARSATHLAEGSVVCRALRAMYRPIAELWTGLGRLGASAPQRQPDNMPSSLQRLSAQSALLNAPRRAAGIGRRAFEQAASVRLARDIGVAAQALPVASAIRLAGLFLLTATLTHVIALVAIPERLRTAMPWFVHVTAIVVAIAMIAANDPIARAWAAKTKL